MELKDFQSNPKELIGKWVRLDYNGSGGGWSVHQIISVTNTSFRISNNDNRYRISDGGMKGGDGYRFRNCTLISDDKAAELKTLAETYQSIKKSRIIISNSVMRIKAKANTANKINETFNKIVEMLGELENL
ncbi:hypothetical protein E6Q11_05185 [Candidatus Dojkabacteria bacterium]|uniref:Uncharacterized protein n=1 Tax=Candidatus Dojkabacteria bacterium TaxID=2099670 RepID=A0A5C7J6Q3_9BACT|nr:MAG: hypothetical protein E6Q11_05185 [Candidatus Dojkabacteria bacterium]